MKSRTKPFSSEKSANSFARIVGGKITPQLVGFSRKVYHVHYKSDGVYKGCKLNDSETYDFEGYTHNYSDI